MMEQSEEARSLIQLIKYCPRHQLEQPKDGIDSCNTVLGHHQHPLAAVVLSAPWPPMSDFSTRKPYN